MRADAQESRAYDTGFSIGAAINYGGIYFESDGDFLNEIWENSFGYQFHVMYGYTISPVISLNGGVELFINRYNYVEQRSPETNQQGEPSGNYYSFSMQDEVGTTYLTLPLNFIVRPLQNKSYYAVVGPDISFKVAHKNSIINVYREDESGQNRELEFEQSYDTPEQSRNTLLFVNAGLGYSIDSARLPLNIEIKAKHAIHPYMDGENFIKSWVRNVSFGLSYRL
jgi:hypothetical protein